MEKFQSHENDSHLGAAGLGAAGSNVGDDTSLGNGRLGGDICVRRRGLCVRADSERNPRQED